MTAQQILTLIEAVDPSDTAKMDEIDARVWCCVNNKMFMEHKYWEGNKSESCVKFNEAPYMRFEIPQFTRSRDALKTIRPKGIAYSMALYGAFATLKFWKCELSTPNGEGYYSRGLPTEELAELHAIIQALAADTR